MGKTKLQVIKNEKDAEITELYLHGRIGEPVFDEETITVKAVKEKLDMIDTDKIVVHLYSGGGCLFSSIVIHNLLKTHKAEVDIVVDSLAGSGGSIIAMAGDKIKMYSNAMLFIHPASTITFGNANDHEKMATDLRKMDKSLKENYRARFNGTDQELEDLIHNETWLTAEEAKDLGFCDSIIESSTENSVKNTLLNEHLKYKPSKVKADLMKKYGKRKAEQGKQNVFNNFKCKRNLLNNFK
ncbi:ATP-dependent protease ClpP, protease subunit [Natronincola peptidivorans]|uniref:ATP-dependent protease ClpP, protease subunit n=1 Tax=Natronincola peptidivorans TaxID=426128 RepID=A0A1I0E0U1_9FIRM|nr:head maturation protease, ClpP-related [Natronincola peptidivorans]SET38582.1 ATP-dependent protease ClpP, protease subunit [Natronincola peptidivorans]